MQLYAAYAEGCDLREISTIIGAEALSERDKIYLMNGEKFETEFIAQGEFEKRRVEDTLGIGWRLFSALPEEDLKLISEELIKKYLPKYSGKS
jgi:V/A-type H+-transporting ATPase subunit B